MPEPVPTPTAADKVSFAEITLVPVDDVLSLVSADSDQDVSNEKWLRTLDDIDRWPTIRDDAGDIKRVGTIEFFEGKNNDVRLNIRNLIRERYGLVAIISETEAVLTGVSSLEWF